MSGAVAASFGEQNTCKRQTALGARGFIAHEAADHSGIEPILPKPRLRPAPDQIAARPMRVFSNEPCEAAETCFTGMPEQYPFHQFLRSGISDCFLYGGRIADLALSHQIDRVLCSPELGRYLDRRHTRTSHIIRSCG